VALLLFLLSTGVLEVTTPHYGATLSIDRTPRGTTPLPPLTLPAGLHLVELHLRGRPSWSRLVFLPPGERVVLEVRLPEKVEETTDKSSPYVPPPWILSGQVGVSATRLAAARDLDLDQRWFLAAREPLGAGTRLQVDASAATDLAGDGAFLRDGASPYFPPLWLRQPLGPRAQDRRGGTRIALDEARLEARPGPLRLAAGRLALTGPDRQPLGIDGVQAHLPLAERFTLRALGGRRFDPLDHPGLGAGGGLGLRVDTKAAFAGLDHFFNEVHHIDAQVGWSDATWSLAAQATTAEAELMATRLDLRWRGPVHGALGHHYQGELFTRPADFIGLLPPDASHEHRLDLILEAEGLRGHLASRLPRQASSRQPRVLQGEFAARTPIRGLGVALTTLLADAPRDGQPALNAHAHLAATTHHHPGPVRLATEVGLAALDLRDPGGRRATRLLPQGHLGLEVDLIDDLALALEGRVGAVHPMWAADGGPLVTGLLALRLR
jgi:hypothetical protein